MTPELGIFSSVFEVISGLCLAFSSEPFRNGIEKYCKYQKERATKAIPGFVTKPSEGHRLTEATESQLREADKDLAEVLRETELNATWVIDSPIMKGAFIYSGIFGLFCLFTYGLEEYSLIQPEALQIALTIGGLAILILEVVALMDTVDVGIKDRNAAEVQGASVTVILQSLCALIILACAFGAKGESHEHAAYLPVFLTFVLVSPFMMLYVILYRLKYKTDQAINVFYAKLKEDIGAPSVRSLTGQSRTG